jgi:electron transfer flavoprotein alpha subunit
MSTLVVAEQKDGTLNRASWEAIAAAQQIGGPLQIVVAGANVGQVAAELAAAEATEIVALEHERLGTYTPDAFVQALAAFIHGQQLSHVVFAHTYQARDFVPRLAARLDRALITDCTAVRMDGGTAVFTRPMFQGKVSADVAAEGSSPHLVTFQIGAFRADAAKRGAAAAPIRNVPAALDESAMRQTADAPFREAKQAVDLTQAERIVSVGRGIKGQEHLALIQQLAEALGAEVAASRPICDAGWLPMERQIGSSGQTVAPKLYLALGISGAIQHVVGMKGARTIVAVNKDADAPIFEVADYGIVGDLFDVVPAMITALKA